MKTTNYANKLNKGKCAKRRHLFSFQLSAFSFHSFCLLPSAFCMALLLSPAHAFSFEFDGSLKEVQITDSSGINQPPTAIATSSGSGVSFSFDADGSLDADGTIKEYRWDFGDGTTGTGVTATHQYAVSGDYPVTLTVLDNLGGIGLAQIIASSWSCSSTPSVTQETGLYSISKIGNFSNVYFRGTTYHGTATKNICRVDISMAAFLGNITAKDFVVEIYKLGAGNKLDTLIAAAKPVKGSAIPLNCGMVPFTFDMPAELSPGSAIVVKMAGAIDSNNYAGACNNAFKNYYTDGEFGTWNQNLSVDGISTIGSDLGFKLYEVE
ncbi:MAG: PKD domain-containing protein [Desulfobulbaceae bacterium]|nr:PKD domain-containing protein [Desulfobulbaceae bacterium]